MDVHCALNGLSEDLSVSVHICHIWNSLHRCELSLHHHFPLYKLSMMHFSSMLVKKKLKSGAFLNKSEVGEGPALRQPLVQAALLWVLYTRTGITTRMDS